DTNRAAGHGSLPTQARAVGHGSPGVLRHDLVARSRTSRCSASGAGFARATESWGEASEGGRSPSPKFLGQPGAQAAPARPVGLTAPRPVDQEGLAADL